MEQRQRADDAVGVFAMRVERDDLARVAVAAATGATPAGVLSVDDIVREATRAQ
ncbi:MAG: hypothetical protein ACK4ZY_16795 [Sphingomonas sp.]